VESDQTIVTTEHSGSCASQGFAASSGAAAEGGPVKPEIPSNPAEGTESYQAAADTSSSDSEDEAVGPEPSELLQGPELPETEKDELLKKIQSSSKKHQRQVYSHAFAVPLHELLEEQHVPRRPAELPACHNLYICEHAS